MAKTNDKTPAPLEVWEQQPTESAEAYTAFAHYRDSAPAKRSLRVTAEELKRNVSTIANYSSKFGWQQRVRSFDHENERVRLAVLREEGIDASRRHAETTAQHITGLSKMTEELLRRLDEKPDLLKKISDVSLIKLATAAARATPRLIVAERLALGLSSENIGGHDGGPINEQGSASGMTDSELDAFLLGAQAQAQLQGAPSKQEG